MFHDPTRNRARARQRHVGGEHLAGDRAGDHEFERAGALVEQDERAAFRAHDAAGDLHDLGEQFVVVGDRIDQRADLDQSLCTSPSRSDAGRSGARGSNRGNGFGEHHVR